jgi:hypothetical protein
MLAQLRTASTDANRGYCHAAATAAANAGPWLNSMKTSRVGQASKTVMAYGPASWQRRAVVIDV